ncbi:MAG: MazG family protein [Clostridia bacterium]|nr:MazG family protein [Clostridia bacterium]
MNTQEQNQALIRALLAKETYNFDDLCCIVSVLRGERGCPWDIEQTHHSIRKGMIEECYEVVEAIDTDNTALLREELGDVLLQIVFHADIEKDAGNFNIDDVAHDECIKMIHRHPHVFGSVQADTSEKVLENWELIKNEEKQRISLSDKLNSIPPMLPALMRASKVAKKTEYAQAMSPSAMIEQIKAQLDALEREGADQAAMLGEILMNTTALCRKYDVDAEEALTATTNTMIARVASEES